MLSDNDIHEILANALLTTEVGASKQHEFGLSLEIIGEDSIFDSLDTMLFLDSVDDQITAKIGHDIGLLGDDAFGSEESPFKNMGTLAAYIKKLVSQYE